MSWRAPAAFAAALLAWLGRQGTRAIAAVVFVGVAVPPLDRLLKPFVAEAIFVLLCLAFLRVDLAALRGYFARPTLPLLATAWTMLAVPLLFGAACLAVGLPERAPDLFVAIMLQAAAPPMMAAPAFAAVMGLDATLVLIALVLSMAATPVAAPCFAYLFLGRTLAIAPLTLGIKLFAMLAGSLAVAAALRRLIGTARIERRKQEIDGLNIVVVFVFVAAVMENLAGRFAATPAAMIGLLALAFLTAAAVLALTFAAFASAGREQAFALAMMASQRNMGLMLAAAGGALPELGWLYFALCQFPIYLAPQLLSPLARRLTGSRLPPGAIAERRAQ